MLFELFLFSVGVAVLVFKEARDLLLGAIINGTAFVLWAHKLLFGKPRPTKDQLAPSSNTKTSKEKNAPRVPPRPKIPKKNPPPVIPSRKNPPLKKAPPAIPSRKNTSDQKPRDNPPIPPRRRESSKTEGAKKKKAEDDKKEALAKAEKRKTKRKNAELEMVDCEESYIKSLKILRDVYQEPMEKNRKSLGIDEKDLRTIFSPMLPAIITLHETILGEFKEKGGRKSGEVLNTKAPYFKMYVTYLNGYDRSMDVISEMRKKNKRFHKFLQKQRRGDVKEQRRWKYMDIASYLIMPVQRIPRYELLLKEIIKNTPEGDPELSPLKTALDMVREAAQHNNQSMRSYQDVQKIVEIQSLLVGELKDQIIQPHRVLVSTFVGDVTMLNKTEAEKLAGNNWESALQSSLERTKSKGRLRAAARRRKSSLAGSLSSALSEIEEKVKRLKKLEMEEEECDIFVFSDLLVWVSRRDINHRQGFIDLDDSVKARDLRMDSQKSPTLKQVSGALICSPVVQMRYVDNLYVCL
uniref:DH domain-containing protein n=1 Tax=Lotharella globosa TaxID=91324 RepID=A0A7S3YNK9_9EUKA